ncbi:hypothetical protein [Nocardia sp. NPDC046763]|uniref:hypothetical protein n=1 Tax=Nocardia sp. NPDC046763 TaxID=3155256 RepID=UPI0033D2E863
MTATDLPKGLAANGPYGQTDTAVDALEEVVFGSHGDIHAHVWGVLADHPGPLRSDLTYTEQSDSASALLRFVIESLGRPAREIAADTHLRGALIDWAAVASPQSLLMLIGHLDLSIGAILTLGNGSEYQQRCLASLDTGAAVGVPMLTELGGANGADQQTTATWDPAANGFWLTSPTPGSIKMMADVADVDTPKTVVVTALVLVNGRDEGVFPFLLELCTWKGMTRGVNLVRLPERLGALRDRTMIRFDRVWLPREALLGGDWARIDDHGRFECALPQRKRFHRAIGIRGNGRLDLANASVAMARAGLVGLVDYSRRRQPGAEVLVAERDAVQRDLITGLAAVYAIGALGRRLREACDTFAGPADPQQALWLMLAKPLLSYTAHQVLVMCRHHAAAQGSVLINHLVDWIATTTAIITAEGENQIMQTAAGKLVADLGLPQLSDPPISLPWYGQMLIERERIIADGLNTKDYGSAGVARGPDAAAIELATATAERLAMTALFIDALHCPDPLARPLLVTVAAAYALDRIHARGTWYAEHALLPADHGVRITAELRLHHAVLAENLSRMVAAFDTPAVPGPILAEDYIQAWLDHSS